MEVHVVGRKMLLRDPIVVGTKQAFTGKVREDSYFVHVVHLVT